MKEQFKSYSEAAAENVMVCPSEGLTDPATLKKVVKSVVQEEDRSRNVIIFGLPERKDERRGCKRRFRTETYSTCYYASTSRVGKILRSFRGVTAL